MIMRFYFLAIVLSILLSFTAEVSMGQAQMQLSLKDAINLALDNNSDLAVGRLQRGGSEFAMKEAKGNNLPKVTLYGTYNRNIDKQVIFLPEGFGAGGATRIGSDNNFNTYLDLSVPIYSKYNSANNEFANSNLQLQTESIRSIRQSVIANVKKSYFSYSVLVIAQKVRQKALDNALENFDNIHNKKLLGVATEFDETTAQVKITTARSSLLEAESQTIPAANSLKLLLGIPVETEISLTDSLSLADDERILSDDADALQNNSNLKQKTLKIAIAKRQAALVKANYFPTLSGVGTYQFQSQQNDFNFPKYNWVKTSSLGLRLQFPLFNGTITRNKVQQALMSEKIAEIQRSYTAKSNLAEFRRLISELKFALQRIELQNENMEMAKKALLLAKERYNYGRSTFLEVNNAELEYTTVQLNYLQAVLDYKSAYYDVELLTGKEN